MLTVPETADMACELLALLSTKPADVDDLCADLGVSPRKLNAFARELTRRGYVLAIHRDFMTEKMDTIALDAASAERARRDAEEYVGE